MIVSSTDHGYTISDIDIGRQVQPGSDISFCDYQLVGKAGTAASLIHCFRCFS